MQGLNITSENNSTYGTQSNNTAGTYEYALAASNVSAGGGTLTVANLVNSYSNENFGTQGQKRYQVIQVPQYIAATLGATITAPAWNGATGGIVVLDVAGNLNFNGNGINVNGLGFRGGAGRNLTGGSGITNSDYRSLSTVGGHAQKGEGIAGTPAFVYTAGATSPTSTGFEGYPGGSMARGAAGNAGGGGTDGNPSANDQNSGGGGGANYGAGGRGGNSWSSNLSIGGFGGNLFAPVATSRLVMGGGGGAGTTNNSTGTPSGGLASSGAAGGGIIFVRAGSVSGTGALSANGSNAISTATNDGTGGGGAGGSVLITTLTQASTTISVTANGGTGGSNTGGGTAHGPGGGGGGGVIYSNSPLVAATAALGVAGTTAGNTTYNATNGAVGFVNQAIARPALIASNGTNCPPVALDITTGSVTAAATPILPLLAYDTDGSIASYRITSLPSAAQGILYMNGTVANSTTSYTQAQAGHLTFTPAAGYSGNATFQYTAIDNAGAQDATPATYTIPVVTVTNAAPTANNIIAASISNNAGATAIPALSATDTDGTIASFTILTLPTAAQGVLNVNGTAATAGQLITPAQASLLTFAPNSSFVGNATFTFTATDNQGATAAASATYTIPVTAPVVSNIAPIAYDVRSLNISRGSNIVQIASLNAIDIDGTIQSYTIISLPQAGTIHSSLNGPALVVGSVITTSQVFFDPGGNGNNNPSRSFTYSATDNAGAISNIATYTIYVNQPPATNAAPTVSNITTASVTNVGTATITPLTATDSDGTIYTYRIATLPTAAQGTLYVNGVAATANQVITPTQAAQLSFKPANGYTGTASFTFSATDNFGASSGTATYNIPVTTGIDLTISASVLTTGPYYIGQNVTIRYTATNIGTVDAWNGVQVSNMLPATLTHISNTSGGMYTTGTGIWQPNWGGIAIGATYSMDIVAKIGSTGTISQGVTISGNTTDGNPSNNTSTYSLTSLNNEAPVVNDVTTAAITTKQIAQAISPLAGTDADGSVFSYTILTIPNTQTGRILVNGVAASAGQVITPQQATQLAWLSATTNTGTLTFTYIATDDKGAQSLTPATYTIPVVADVDIALATSVVTAGPFEQGQVITLRYTVSNIATHAVYGIIVENFLPEGLTFIMNSTNEIWRYKSTLNIYEGPGIAAGNTYVIEFTARINTSESITHSPKVIVTSNTPADFNPVNNSSTYSIQLPVNNPPTADDVKMSMKVLTEENAPVLLDPLSASNVHASRTIDYYTILTIPADTEGKLFVNTLAAVVGQKLTSEEATQLSFQPNAEYTGELFFRYMVTDNAGASSASATYSITVVNSTYPVSLTNFTAQLHAYGVTLKWSTASEQDNDFFEVQRSLDGIEFTTVGKVKGAGNSRLKIDYNYLDAHAPAGLLYYRLKQNDFDGTYEFSKLVTVTSKGTIATQLVQAYPNPFTSYLSVELPATTEGKAKLQLLDLQGRIVLTKAIHLLEGMNQLDVATEHLSKGMYILTVSGNGIDQKVKVLKEQ
ncbi:Ig-like domain-containing protein [Pontibacter qinzhouensis]|nr:Ig-like domain-containing protein [Pontibacter qinzhouensis]